MRVDAPVRIDMLGVREVKYNRLFVLVAWKWQKIFAAGWRKRRMALLANLLF